MVLLIKATFDESAVSSSPIARPFKVEISIARK